MYACHSECVDNLCESLLSFYLMSHWYQTQVIRLGGSSLYPPSHLAGLYLKNNILINSLINLYINTMYFDHFHLHPISPPSFYWIHPPNSMSIGPICASPILRGLEAICWCVVDLSEVMPLKKLTLMLGNDGTCF